MIEKSRGAITIIQNIVLSDRADSGISLSLENLKNQKVTDAYFLDEEPVFSDTDEEKEYTERVFYSPNKTNTFARPGRCEIGIQCDISEHLEILDIIKIGASLSSNKNDDFNGVITLCKSLAQKYAKTGEDSDTSATSSCSKEVKRITNHLDKTMIRIIEPELKSTVMGNESSSVVCAISKKFLPSRSSGNGDFLSENVDSKLSVRSDCISSTSKNISKVKDKKKKKKKIKSKVSNFNKENIFQRQSKRVKQKVKKFSNDGTLILNKNTGDQFQREVEKSEFNDRSSIKSFLKNMTPGEDIKKNGQANISVNNNILIQGINENEILNYLTDYEEIQGDSNELNEVHIKIPLPKQIVRPLARNWMNPNNTFGCVLEHRKRQTQNFTSFQNTAKMRRLYSPNEWLHSEEFAKLAVPDPKPRRNIFT